MKTYNITIYFTANSDIQNTTAYIFYELKNKLAARKFNDDIYNSIEKLKHMPERNSLITHKELSDLDIRIQHMRNYYIFYSIEENDENVEIIRVLHSRQNWVNILKEKTDLSSNLFHEVPEEYITGDDVSNQSIITSAEFRNNYNSISELCNEQDSHVLITKNKKTDIVVMSVSEYERMSKYIG